MDISFESFAFKKRQSVLQIESDKEEECDNEEEEERGSSCSTKSWNVSDQEADQLGLLSYPYLKVFLYFVNVLKNFM